MKSMETLSIKDGPMQESEVFPLGESVAHFDESAKLDMNTSMQQSKLDLSLAHMSIQTIDSDDSILKAQKQSWARHGIVVSNRTLVTHVANLF